MTEKQALRLPCAMFVFVAAISGASFAQVTFEKTYGGSSWDEGRSVQQTPDCGYVIAGHTRSFGSGLSDVYLVKTDSLGDTLWTRTYGGSEEDEGYSVQQTLDGGYVIAGRTSSFGAGSTDVYLVKTDSLGDTLWTRTYGGGRRDEGYSVQQTQDGGYIIAGRTSSFGAGLINVFLVKTDSLGGTAWTSALGGDRYHEGNCVRQTPDGGYVIAGYALTAAADSKDVYLLKTDPAGNAVWTKTYGGAKNDVGWCVQRTLDGGYIITGFMYSSDVDSNEIWLLKTTPLGDTTWTRAYGGSKWEAGYSVRQTLDGGYVVTGYTESFGAGQEDLYIVKTDSMGDTMWTRTYGGAGADHGECVRQTQDGGYIIAGRTASSGAGNYDLYLVKTEGSGVVGIGEWASESRNPAPGFQLFENHPNPFANSTVITYSLRVAGHVALEIYDIAGRRTSTLVDGIQGPGTYHVRWRAENAPSGVYFSRFKAGEFLCARKMVVFR